MSSYTLEVEQMVQRHDRRARVTRAVHETAGLANRLNQSTPAPIPSSPPPERVIELSKPIAPARMRRRPYRTSPRTKPLSLIEVAAASSATQTTSKPQTLEPLKERHHKINPVQGRRFARLTGVAPAIAVDGIQRHLRACDRMDVNPDLSAIREIIYDALNGLRIFAGSNEPLPGSTPADYGRRLAPAPGKADEDSQTPSAE